MYSSLYYILGIQKRPYEPLVVIKAMLARDPGPRAPIGVEGIIVQLVYLLHQLRHLGRVLCRDITMFGWVIQHIEQTRAVIRVYRDLPPAVQSNIPVRVDITTNVRVERPLEEGVTIGTDKEFVSVLGVYDCLCDGRTTSQRN